ncbi:MAG: TlpA disulfide reductase family protein [Ginsengibacter sp.]
MKKYLLLGLFSLGLIVTTKGQGTVTISPEHPMPGDSVIIIYKPNISSEKQGVNIPVLHFTYSNFYELPVKMEMDPSGSDWKVGIKLPPYAILATFVIDDGETTVKPSDKTHYEIVVYNKKKERVENSYLNEGYSLSAQEGRIPKLKDNQAALYKEELQHYPDNYSAKLTLLNYRISKASESEKAKLYKEANDIIAQKFYTDPGLMAYTNLTTMGYLIMGEKTRLDSLRNEIRKKFPTSEAGYELRIDDISSLKDSAKMVSGLESLLKKENAKNKKYLTGAHRILFKYYARKRNLRQTLHHLSYLSHPFTPYTPSDLKEQAEVLYNNSIALDTAMALAKRSIAYVDTFPISLIRYFPETGYLPSFVTREQRATSVKAVTGQLKSLMALILVKQGKKDKAHALMAEAEKNSTDNETLKNAGIFYTKLHDFQSAFNAYRRASYNDPVDTTSYSLMESNYQSWKGSMNGIEKYVQEIEEHWMAEMNKLLQKEIISKPLPDVLSSYVDLKGKSLSPELIRNKIVIMDFWATWCGPCMQAMPFMQQVYEKYKDDSNVVFMIVNSGSQNELSDAQGWWGNKTFSFPVYYNKDRTVGDKLGFNVIPATFVIDKKGNIRFKTIGFEGKGMTRKLTAEIELLKK